MSSQLKLRRGSTVSHAGFTGADGEVTFNTDTNALVTHDGVTAGGHPAVKQSDITASTGASLIGNTPAGTVAATTVQGAIDELDTEKLAAADLAASYGSSLVGYMPAGPWAVATTIEAQLHNIQAWAVNVKDAPFYAKGDGITDDTAAFNAALAASLRVYAPEGRYLIDGVIRIKRTGASICGDGYSSTVLFGSDISTNPVISVKSDTWESLGTRIADINISDITLSGRAGYDLSDRDLLSFWGVGYECSVTRVHFDGVKRRAIYAKDLWDTLFLGCRITHCGYSNTNHHAVLLDGDVGNSNAVRFIGGHFEGNPTGDFWLRGSTNQIFFIGNKFEGSNADAAYLDFHVFHAEQGCSNIIFSANTVTSNHKNPSKHWMYSGATSTQITGNTFQCANDLLGSCLLKFEGPASLIGSKVVGNSFYADGSTGEYPFDLGNAVVFQANTVNAVNPRKLFRVANGSSVADNTVIGKGTVNQSGDVFCYFSAALSLVKDNHIGNTVNKVLSNLTANFNEPISEIAYVSVINNFDPNQYKSGTVFTAVAAITSIAASYHGKTISLQCGGANTLTHNSSLSIVLNGNANFSPPGWGLISLVFVNSIGWVEQGRMTWF